MNKTTGNINLKWRFLTLLSYYINLSNIAKQNIIHASRQAFAMSTLTMLHQVWVKSYTYQFGIKMCWEKLVPKCRMVRGEAPLWGPYLPKRSYCVLPLVLGWPMRTANGGMWEITVKQELVCPVTHDPICDGMPWSLGMVKDEGVGSEMFLVPVPKSSANLWPFTNFRAFHQAG